MQLNDQNESQNDGQNNEKSRDIVSSTDILCKFQARIYVKAKLLGWFGHPVKVEVNFHVLNNLESEQIGSINAILPKNGLDWINQLNVFIIKWYLSLSFDKFARLPYTI